MDPGPFRGLPLPGRLTYASRVSRSPGGTASPGAAALPAADPPVPPSPSVAAGRLRAPYRPGGSSVPAAFALAGCGLLILRLVQRQTGTTGLLVGLGLAVLPLPLVLGSAAWLNRVARVPLRHAVFCLAWGACTATTVAIVANDWAGGLLVAYQGSALGTAYGADVASPLIEEICKAAALVVLLLPVRRRPSCRTGRSCALLAGARTSTAVPQPRNSNGSNGSGRAAGLPRIRPHLRPLPYFRPAAPLAPGRRPHARARTSPRTLAAGTVLGAVTACGFAFTENALYLGRAFTGDRESLPGSPTLRDFDTTVHTFVLRVLLSPFAHPLFTVLTGLGIAVALTTGHRLLSRVAAPAGLAAAVGLHGVWNAAAGLGTEGFLLVYGLVMVPSFAGLVCFAVWARTRRGPGLPGRPDAPGPPDLRGSATRGRER